MLDHARVLERCHQVAGGVKALAALAFSVGLAMADYYDAVPLQPLLQHAFGADAATKIALFAPIIFGTLRYVSTNQIKWQHEEHKEPF